MKHFLFTLWTGVRSTAGRLWSWSMAHKIMAGIIVLIILSLGYVGVSATSKGAGTTQYALAAATQGALDVTVTDSGEVSAEHQLSLSPKASGTVQEVDVVAGQSVKAGQIIATLDASDANDSVRTAEQNLTSAQITYKQAITSDQNNLSNDQRTLETANTNLSNAITSAFADVPTAVNGLDSTLHSLSTLAGFNAEQNLDAYTNYIHTTESQQQHDQIASEYQTAVAAYKNAETAFRAYDVNTATPEQTEALAATVTTALQDLNQATRDTLAFLNYINGQVIQGGRPTPTSLSTNISNISSYLSTITSAMTSIQSARTSLTTATQAYSGDTQTLEGSNVSLDIQSAQLNLQKSQDALAQAQKAEEDYIVRAPFNGTIASVSVKEYDSASSGTAVAVLITKENYVTLSVNESDAAALAVGQKASITFDAIDGLTVDGTVAEVDQIGTVNQGVATYTVKVGFDSQDTRIKPGMTAEATITTASAADAIQIPSSAVHTTNGMSYVEVATLIGTSTTMTGSTTRQFGTNSMASSTARFRNASTTGARTASSTFAGFRTGSATTFGSRSLTVAANKVKIVRVPVTIGISSDTMTQITSGINRGQLVVTQTTTGSTSSNATSNGLFGLFGARRTTTSAGTTGSGTNRTFTGAGATGATFRAGGAGAAGFGGGVRIGG